MSIPPYDGPCKRCDVDPQMPGADIAKLGPLRGWCAACRPLVTEERRIAREARDSGGGSPPDPLYEGDQNRADPPAKRQPKLKDACVYLAKKADKLDKALETRKLANREAQAALSAFKEQLTLVGRVAQSLINQSAPRQPDP